MNNGHKYHGVVVPMVTPITAAAGLDEPALDRLIDSLLAGGVEGIFVLGTTGEGAHVPRKLRRGLVERAVKRVRGRAVIYAGLGDMQPGDFPLANDFFQEGADAVVAHPPIARPVPTQDLLVWFQDLLDQLDGPLILYNMPSTTRVTIPLDVVAKLVGHPRLAGIKDSENNPKRHAELLKRFGKQPGFSIFVGVGALMGDGLKSGAAGIVPSVGNLIPDVCHRMYTSAGRGDWAEFDTHFARMNAVAALYQKGRTLDESLAALKAAVHWRGICDAHVLPPLRPVAARELESIRMEMVRLELLN
jgi:dihydrodipicolinate synthase/N-acetylneuraminate lyase